MYISKTAYLLTELSHDQSSLPYLQTTSIQPQWIAKHGQKFSLFTGLWDLTPRLKCLTTTNSCLEPMFKTFNTKYIIFYPVPKDPALPKMKSISHKIFYHIKLSCQSSVYKVSIKSASILNRKYIFIKFQLKQLALFHCSVKNINLQFIVQSIRKQQKTKNLYLSRLQF